MIQIIIFAWQGGRSSWQKQRPFLFLQKYFNTIQHHVYAVPYFPHHTVWCHFGFDDCLQEKTLYDTDGNQSAAHKDISVDNTGFLRQSCDFLFWSIRAFEQRTRNKNGLDKRSAWFDKTTCICTMLLLFLQKRPQTPYGTTHFRTAITDRHTQKGRSVSTDRPFFMKKFPDALDSKNFFTFFENL